jgi:ribosomal protein L23
MIKELFSIQVSKVVHLITSTKFGRLSRRRGSNHTYELFFFNYMS